MSSKTQRKYDVVIVGSGAGGGMAGYVLAHAGLKVLMLEAGRHYDPTTETPMFNTPNQAPLRGVGTPEKPFGFYDATVDGGWQVPNEPYTSAPGSEFQWWRARMLGGRTNHWGRIALRMGPYDFKPRARDGLGIDWPMTYDEMAPWYDKTEELIGVFGSNEGLENTPNSSPGVLHAPPKPRGYELLTKKHCDRLGIPVIPSHLAILTRPINGRAACFYATDCGRGCSIKANFQSTTVLLPPAVETGNLDIRTGAMAREVTLGKDGKANGVVFVDKATGKDDFAPAHVVVLAASACETARIMLNSKSNQFPDGIANTTGLVGKYLMDTVGARLAGHIPMLENLPPHNEDGASGMHMYMPWWGYQQQAKNQLDFPRGYHIEFGGGRRMPHMGSVSWVPAMQKTYGRQLKEDARRYYGAVLNFSGRGEMIPNEDCYCEIDPDVKDKWGIPVLRFHWKFSDYELKQAVHMQQTFKQIIESMGGTIFGEAATEGSKCIYPGGAIIHEVGTTCMGDDRKKSVLNQWGQAWDVPNLFVTDGAPFVSNADKNPTLTILALAMRNCDHLAGLMKGGEL
ncbi:MAG: FAD-binding protein [Planctomycetes bacterium]|nr:FAD-binding protein [Planctomycetota bacterium]